jgi:hypothetical protein
VAEHRPFSQAKRQVGSIALVVMGGLALTILLAICLITALLPTLSRVAGAVLSNAPAASGAHATASPSRAATAAPTATAAPHADWYTFTSMGGFRIDVPSVLGSSHGYFIDNFTGQGVDLSYLGAPATTGLQRLAAEVTVTVLYATQITDRNICPHGGTPIRVGSGSATFPAWERHALSTSDAILSVTVNLVLRGVAIEIDLVGQGPPQTFLARYGVIWRHLLASFAPVPGRPPAATRPCG